MASPRSSPHPPKPRKEGERKEGGLGSGVTAKTLGLCEAFSSSPKAQGTPRKDGLDPEAKW